MSDETTDAIYDVLVEECGATPRWREQFRAAWPDCGEFRFQGDLGFGGKVYAPMHRRDVARVDCYSEDYTPERKASIERANVRLRELGGAS